jgi:NAD(P)-dependent dehydrogenase (short-subunit alcohol dehydrogenase family)
VSVVGALTAIQSVVPSMLSRGTGTVLFTGGGLALYPSAGVTSLSIGKAAIRNLAFCVAEELVAEPIRVGIVSVFGTVEPGTPFDPAKIADAFWEVYVDQDGSLGVEIQFKGRPDSSDGPQ